MYTPPSLIDPNGTQGTMFLPGQRGGANWPGAAADPETGILYVASVAQPVVSSIRPCPEGRTPTLPGMTYCGGVFYPAMQGGLPPIKPPWGRITAIDMNTGDHLWWVPNADASDFVKNHPALEGVELPRTGRQDRVGILVTKTLLIAGEGSGLFAAGPFSGGPILRAYDKRTGDILSEFELPAHQTGVSDDVHAWWPAIHRACRRRPGPPGGAGGAHTSVGEGNMFERSGSACVEEI